MFVTFVSYMGLVLCQNSSRSRVLVFHHKIFSVLSISHVTNSPHDKRLTKNYWFSDVLLKAP